MVGLGDIDGDTVGTSVLVGSADCDGSIDIDGSGDNPSLSPIEVGGKERTEGPVVGISDGCLELVGLGDIDGDTVGTSVLVGSADCDGDIVTFPLKGGVKVGAVCWSHRLREKTLVWDKILFPTIVSPELALFSSSIDDIL
jgi:hypothetical protein